MFSAKPLASLSSTLLARKGHARPAMRPQGVAIDDLGWNDMGHAAPAVHVAVVPPVLVERAALAEEVAASVSASAEAAPVPAVAAPISTATVARVARESAQQTRTGKAAFTLRLDPERHLRLRLASAVANRSGQQIVGEALDAFLAQMPGLDALVAGVSPSNR
ncbi:hypothetical protein [Sphingomonas sp.]|uniref:hypothetical protein n=1 Tax=Sphingomonas sp. TaxID=28214 RepID=UPI0035BC1DA2